VTKPDGARFHLIGIQPHDPGLAHGCRRGRRS
jgi:hypothetical protein